MASFKEVKEILTKMVEELLEIEEKGKNPTNKWINYLNYMSMENKKLNYFINILIIRLKNRKY